MEHSKLINCYCFNPLCKRSIFSINTCVAVQAPLSKVLSDPIYCAGCKSELVSKPTLEIKSQISSCLNQPAPLKVIVINGDPVFHTVIKTTLNKFSSFEKIWHCSNGLDALSYLEKNKDHKELLPDLILVDINMDRMNGWEFLENYQNLYPSLAKRSSVYMTTSALLPAELMKSRDYKFIKGTISKPLKMESLKEITSILEPVLN